MGTGRQEIKGTKIYNEINSSNLSRTEYDTADNKMIAEPIVINLVVSSYPRYSNQDRHRPEE